ncbi:MAG: hypothetical protein ACRDHL_12420 [Candidatus Promineifilaceae bacterium]
MSVRQKLPPKPLTRGMRLGLIISAALVFTIGISLNLLSSQTERFFAWTIGSALTAAFLGGSYWAAGVLELMAGRQRRWADARVAVPAVIVFTGLTLLATLLHRANFHFDAPLLITRVGTWVWLAIYIIVPFSHTALLAAQLKAAGGEPERARLLPAWLRRLQVVAGLPILLTGMALFVAPLAAGAYWPWALTALTGRAVGAWLVGLGVLLLHGAGENAPGRLRPLFASLIAFGLLQATALLRFGGEMEWLRPAAWLVVAFIGLCLVIGLAGWRLAGLEPAGPST